MRKINIEGTSNIVNLCIANYVKKLCFVSSIATIEKSIGKKFITEENEWNIEKNNYGYAITKYGAEMEVWRASQENVDVVIVNPGVILGAGFWNNWFWSYVFIKLIKECLFILKVLLVLLHVTDVVKIMIQLMNSTIKNERYILVSENVSFKTVFNEIALKFK